MLEPLLSERLVLEAYAPLDGHCPVSLDVVHVVLQASGPDASRNAASILREKIDLFFTNTPWDLNFGFAFEIRQSNRINE